MITEASSPPRSWPNTPCTWPDCHLITEDHRQVVIFTNTVGNFAVRLDTHMWPTRKYNSWIGTHGSRWSTGDRDREAYRRARDRARGLLELYEGASLSDQVRVRFLHAYDRFYD